MEKPNHPDSVMTRMLLISDMPRLVAHLPVELANSHYYCSAHNQHRTRIKCHENNEKELFSDQQCQKFR